MPNDHNEQIRIVQETVAGKEITFAHIMGGPAPVIYQKLGLNPQVDYRSSAIGIMNMTPPESAVIASDIAVKSGNVYLGFADRFTGTLIITGEISEVESAMTEILQYFGEELGYVVCKLTKR
ncbi:MAG: BMC domain-containing protein [Lachnospiraceae bacterium]|nr:BMC domain-containing protein [Lachnospiraceae bacterium]